MSLDPRALHIYTDGSCYKNPGGKSGCAAIVRYPDHLQQEDEQIVDFGCRESSNNRMELLACIRALEWVRNEAPWSGVGRVQIVTDSLYLKENVLRAPQWKKQGWRNRYGEPRENWDLWKQLLSQLAKVRLRVDFEWACGKKSPILKGVDRAAKMAAGRGGLDVDRGYKPGRVSRSMVKGAAIRFPATGQSAVIRIYGKKVMAKGENKVRFDLFSEADQTYIASYFAFATPALATELHAQHCYRVRFNDDGRYPQALELIEEVQIPKRSHRAARPSSAGTP